MNLQTTKDKAKNSPAFLPLERHCTVGFEIEFSGLSVQQTLDALQQQLQGQIQRISLAERSITHASLGDFHIELDWSYLKKQGRRQSQSESGEKAWLRELGTLAEKVVPMEVVCPPLSLNQCQQLLPLVEALREAGARDTDESWLAAYGVHINTQAPALDVTTLQRYLRAFALLQWWLFDAHEVNTTRKLSPYIEPYPEAYVRRLLSHDCSSVSELMDDYLAVNASRNRALDMLPLFAHIDPERVKQKVGSNKVKARPTFHYRLPNCQIEQPQWNLTDSWHGWWVVEQLANDEQALAAWQDEFLQQTRPLIGVAERDWKRSMEQWLLDREWW